jgi:hypothetical protein
MSYFFPGSRYFSKFYPKNILIFIWRNEFRLFRAKIGSHNHIPLIICLSASFNSISTFLHCKQFSIYVFPRKWQISPQISTKYFQNRMIMFCLELWYSQLSAYRKTYFQTELWNCSSTGDSYFQTRTTKMVLRSLNLLFPFLY